MSTKIHSLTGHITQTGLTR